MTELEKARTMIRKTRDKGPADYAASSSIDSTFSKSYKYSFSKGERKSFTTVISKLRKSVPAPTKYDPKYDIVEKPMKRFNF